MACGCISITLSFKGQWELAAWFVYMAAGMDFLDGLAARLLKATSAIGKDLDSLADVVSFGVAPAAGCFSFYIAAHESQALGNRAMIHWETLVFLLIPLLSALRLAKFNHDTRQTMGFRGLPTPAFGLYNVSFIAGLVHMGSSLPAQAYLIMMLNAVVGSLLLVSDIPLMALKSKTYDWSDNWPKYILTAVSVTLTLIFGYWGICAAIMFYIIFSIFAAAK